ncbi:ATP-binding protein [Streptomyces sp. ST2-7A]|uniref:ATP-binding protein n=1 Tax=Streptomyces sp. ST2-7A TaxID=2907214 RepID=UPI001F15FF4D|nr:ATP-binding protein [Streptomyces sp. ST2-7A]MCE7080924.1 ATP-binding protein [Streptomyces sp. ST2-7A]
MDPNHPAPRDEEPRETTGGPERVTEIVAGDFLVTVNPVDGSHIQSCPPGRRPISPRRPPAAAPDAPDAVELLERDEERAHLTRLLSRGRSARLVGPVGSGRTALLEAVARECAGLAPDGVVRLTGRGRSAADLRHELYAAVHAAPHHRPGATELRAALRGIGAVVVVDDLEFGGSALDDLLASTPECAFLLAADPDVPAAGDDSRLEELHLTGLARAAAVDLVERVAGRPLTGPEREGAARQHSAGDGLPLRLTQYGSLLRERDTDPEQAGNGSDPAADTGAPPAAELAGRLPEGAREILRLGLALGGALPGLAQIPALTGDHDASAHLDLLGRSGLVTGSGDHRRLAAGVVADLAGTELAGGGAARVDIAIGHYQWWLEEGRAEPARAVAELDALLAVIRAGQRVGLHEAVAELTRVAAPRAAVSLRWSLWERMLRSGQESAREAGLVSRQAYFHHELGVLSICNGRLDRARAELEASIALRAVLADSSGAHAGRRALALVEDLGTPPSPPLRLEKPAAAGTAVLTGGPVASTPPAGTQIAPTAPLGTPAVPATGPVPALPPAVAATGPVPAPGTEAPTKVLPPVAASGSGAPTGPRPTVGHAAGAAVPAALAGDGAEGFAGPGGDRPHGGPGGSGASGTHGARRGGRFAGIRDTAVAGTRRNMAGAGAGALLVAVLGTVVGLGLTSGEGENPAETGRPDTTAPDIGYTDGGTGAAAEPTEETEEEDTEGAVEEPAEVVRPANSEPEPEPSPSPDLPEDPTGTPEPPSTPGGTPPGSNSQNPSPSSPETTPVETGTSGGGPSGSGGNGTGSVGNGGTTDGGTDGSTSDGSSSEGGGENGGPGDETGGGDNNGGASEGVTGGDEGSSAAPSPTGAPDPSPTGGNSAAPVIT